MKYTSEKACDDLEDKHEHLENMSRRNNVKIIGLNEDTGNEKTWEDTEELVITTIKKKLDIEGVKIERAHAWENLALSTEQIQMAQQRRYLLVQL